MHILGTVCKECVESPANSTWPGIKLLKVPGHISSSTGYICSVLSSENFLQRQLCLHLNKGKLMECSCHQSWGNFISQMIPTYNYGHCIIQNTTKRMSAVGQLQIKLSLQYTGEYLQRSHKVTVASLLSTIRELYSNFKSFLMARKSTCYKEKINWHYLCQNIRWCK